LRIPCGFGLGAVISRHVDDQSSGSEVLVGADEFVVLIPDALDQTVQTSPQTVVSTGEIGNRSVWSLCMVMHSSQASQKPTDCLAGRGPVG
jgi:hypothetical protein